MTVPVGGADEVIARAVVTTEMGLEVPLIEATFVSVAVIFCSPNELKFATNASVPPRGKPVSGGKLALESLLVK
jgi:hypothetical protein